MAVRRNQARNVLLTGYHGCGKTSVGWELAKLMRRQFVDLPQELERRQRSAYLRIPLWGRAPEPEELETRLVLDLAQRRDLVIALGPDSLDAPDALEESLEFGFLVFLDPPADVLYRRLLSMPIQRELVNSLGQAGIEVEIAKRRSQYERADFQLTEPLPPSRLASLILHCFYT